MSTYGGAATGTTGAAAGVATGTTEPGDDYSHIEQSCAFEPAIGFAHLREQCPVHREASFDPPFYVLSRFDDVVGVLRDHEQWGNSDGPGVFYQHGGVLGSADNPDHGRQRRVLRDAFLPAAVARMEPTLAAIADELLEPFVARGRGDFVEAFALPFPGVIIGELLGVHPADRADFKHWTLQIVAALTGGDIGVYERASAAMGDYVEARVAEREALLGEVEHDRAALGVQIPDDVLSTMLLARRRGEISASELRRISHQVLVAGHETTTSLLGMMLYRLIERPEVLAQLRLEPGLLGPAIEEALRFDSPVNGLFRTNRAAVTIHGEAIEPRTKMQILYASANRDPAKFDQPDEFRLDRDADELRRHVAFGWGIHFCIGAPLARLETKVAFERILSRMHNIELDGEPVRNESFVLHGLTSLPIRWTTTP